MANGSCHASLDPTPIAGVAPARATRIVCIDIWPAQRRPLARCLCMRINSYFWHPFCCLPFISFPLFTWVDPPCYSWLGLISAHCNLARNVRCWLQLAGFWAGTELITLCIKSRILRKPLSLPLKLKIASRKYFKYIWNYSIYFSSLTK